MKIYIAADPHVGYDWGKEGYQRIWKFQSLTMGEKRIYIGDVFELAWLKPEELVIKPEAVKFVHTLQSTDIILLGNHDINNTLLPTNGTIYDLNRIRLMHGHQFDDLSDSRWKRWYYKLAPYLRNVWWDSPWQQKMHSDDKWQPHNGYLWGKAINWLEASDYTTLILGHTHDSCQITRLTGKKLISIGSLPEDGVYGILDTETSEVGIKEI